MTKIRIDHIGGHLNGQQNQQDNPRSDQPFLRSRCLPRQNLLGDVAGHQRKQQHRHRADAGKKHIHGKDAPVRFIVG